MREIKLYKYKRWSDYFDAYLESDSERQKKLIKAAFIRRLFDDDLEYDCDSLNTYETVKGDRLANYLNISVEQKDLFIKYFINKLFDYYKDEKSFEQYLIDKNSAYIREIKGDSLYDTYSPDYMIEKYIYRNLYRYIKTALKRLKNNIYFQCQCCGGVYKKNNPMYKTVQKYCNKCRSKF